jgi:hypothetical protein
VSKPPTKQKAGRKPKPLDEKHGGGAILVRATAAERQAIRKRADTAELSLSRYLVKRALSDQPPPTPEEKDATRQLLYELKKAGNNLNQIAHSLHTSRLTGAPPPAGGEISETLLTIKEATAAIKRRMK